MYTVQGKLIMTLDHVMLSNMNNSNSMEIPFCSHLSCSETIAMKFRTWHDGCVFVACASFVNYVIPYNIVILRPIFHRIQITMNSRKAIIWYNIKLSVNYKRVHENEESISVWYWGMKIYQALNGAVWLQSFIVMIIIFQIKILPKHSCLIWDKYICDDIKLLNEIIMLIWAH